MTSLQSIILAVVNCQPYLDTDSTLRNYKFLGEERRQALRCEKHKWLKRTDKAANFFEITRTGLSALNTYNRKLIGL